MLLYYFLEVLFIYKACHCSVTDESNLKQKFFDHLNFKRIPEFSKEEYENFQVPTHVRLRYNLLNWKNARSWSGESKRYKRSSEPSLAGLFKQVQINSSINENFIYTSTFREKLQFDMEGKIPQRSKISMAQLRLFKKLPNFNRRMPQTSKSAANQLTQRSRKSPNWRSFTVRHARVSVYHTLTGSDGLEKSILIDSRMIMVNGSGWQSFDVTRAVEQWQKHPVKFMSITLELVIEGSRPGRAAAEIASMVRFTGQQVSKTSPRRPELVVFTEEEEIKSNDCSNLKSQNSRRKCCRDTHYVNFRELPWTQNWIIEPQGYQAYKCTGSCKPSRRKTSRGFPRTCTISESSPLAVMYLIKRGNTTNVEVSEFPNMIVKKCSCSLDSFYQV